MKVRAEVFSPSGQSISVRIIERPTVAQADDELFDWFNAEFSVGYCCAVDLLDAQGEVVEGLHDWHL